jgi:hypothetical protein
MIYEYSQYAVIIEIANLVHNGSSSILQTPHT